MHADLSGVFAFLFLVNVVTYSAPIAWAATAFVHGLALRFPTGVSKLLVQVTTVVTILLAGSYLVLMLDLGLSPDPEFITRWHILIWIAAQPLALLTCASRVWIWRFRRQSG
jgi:hypothetical protein